MRNKKTYRAKNMAQGEKKMDEFINLELEQSEYKTNISELTIEEPTIKETIIEELVEELPTFNKYKVRVMHPSLRKREGPSTQSKEVGLIKDYGIYEIQNEINGWGQLKDGTWIMLSYTQITYK